MDAARTDGEVLAARFGCRLVPDLQLVLARRNTLDVERTAGVRLGVVRTVDDEDESKHRRMDVAEELNGARVAERLAVRGSLLVQPRIEPIRLREGEDVVEDRVVVAEGDPGPDGDHQHVRHEHLPALTDHLAVRGRGARRLPAGLLQPDDRAAGSQGTTAR